MRKELLFLLLLSVTSAALSQGLTLRSSPSSLRILPGAPADFELTVENSSGKPLRLLGTTLEQALAPKSSVLVNAGGEALDCLSRVAVCTVTSPQPPCQGPAVVFPAGGVVRMPFGIYSERSCPLRDVPPGHYTGKVWIEPYVCEGENVQTMKAALDIPVTVEAPQGQDAAYLRALEQAVRETPPKFSGTYGGALKWMEVLNSPRIHPEQIALSRFPTSTYAGYALIHTGPGGSLSTFEKWWTMTARQRDDAWYVPQAASPARQEARRQLVRSNYQGFVQRAQAFLAIHPDFARADLLRKELANTLFMLDQRDEAVEEVHKLATMKGPVADEARAVLSQAKQSTPNP